MVSKEDCPIKVAVRFEGEVFDFYRGKQWDYFRTHVTVSTNVSEHFWICGISDQSQLKATDLKKAPIAIQRAMLDDTGSKDLGLDNWTDGELVDENIAKKLVGSLFNDDFDADASFVGWKTANMGSQSSAGFIVHARDLDELANELDEGSSEQMQDEAGGSYSDIIQG